MKIAYLLTLAATLVSHCRSGGDIRCDVVVASVYVMWREARAAG
jgi:hypothetical protein